MALDERKMRAYTDILIEELIPAMGCTEPIAIAYAASIASAALGGVPDGVRVGLSGNIIKNVKSVVVPATGGMRGIAAAVAAGLVAAAPERRLEVLGALGESDVPKIEELCRECPAEIYELDTDEVFEIYIEAERLGKLAEARLKRRHTNVTYVALSGEDITQRFATPDDMVERECTDRSLLNVSDIIEYADTVELSEIAPYIKRQIELNLAIANEGLHGEWGAAIGKTLAKGRDGDVRYLARALAAAGSDARMNGCEMPVCIISGSGNQGITASVPVYAYYESEGRFTEEELIRAVIVSDLITVHQKTGIGCLSAYCGAISAGCGAGCGICYLDGGKYYEIAHTLVNSLAILSGTICDGAKASCAAKIAMAVEAGFMGYEMMRTGHQFYSGDGIITKGVENTIRNVGRLARDGMGGTDREIIKIMLGEN